MALSREEQDALQRFEKHPNYPSVHVRLSPEEKPLQPLLRKLKKAPKESDARRKIALQVFDLLAGAYLTLVDRAEQMDDYRIILGLSEQLALKEFSGFVAEVADLNTPAARRMVAEIAKRIRRWETEAYRKLMEPPLEPAVEKPPQAQPPVAKAAKKEPPKKKGIRAEVRAAMKRAGITEKEAAHRLGFKNESALKSLMSDVTPDKTSAATRKRVLETIRRW